MKKSEITKEARKLHSAERVTWLEKAYIILKESMIPTAPKDITITAGFAMGGHKGNTAGTCCPGFMELGEGDTQDLITISFINFKEKDFKWGAGVQVLSVLMHEMLHASGIHSHRAEFSQPAAKLGLIKPWTATRPSDPLAEKLQLIAKTLGPLPAGYGDLMPDKLKKQTTRMRKYTCVCTPKPQIIRAATDDLSATCNDCDDLFVMEGELRE